VTREPKGVSVAPEEPVADKTPWLHVTQQDLISSAELRLPLDIETTYRGHRLTARIEADGNVTWNGTTYDSLSTAGGMARKSVVGAPPGREYPQTNGWTSGASGARARHDDRGQAIGPPVWRRTPETEQHPLEGIDEGRLVLAGGDHPAEAAAVREHALQDVCAAPQGAPWASAA